MAKKKYKKYIKVLSQAAKAFSETPEHNRRNTDGLCNYLYHQGMNTADVMTILGGKYSTCAFTIAPRSQKTLWEAKDEKNLNKRSEWCKERIEYFKRQLKDLPYKV